MDWKTFFSNVVDSVSWPLSIGIIFFLLKEPIAKLLSWLVKLKYKDFELEFRRTLEEAKIEAPDVELESKEKIKDDDYIHKLARTSPSSAVIEAWRILEETAESKLKEILPSSTRKEAPHKLRLEYLIHSGALAPLSEQLLDKLRHLRNMAAHSSEFSISENDAIEYYSLSKRLQKEIEFISELPKFKLTALTLMIIEINHLIDTDKYNHITIDKIEQEIENGTVLEYLEKEAKDDVDLSMFLEGNASKCFNDYYIKQLQQLYNCCRGNERRKWGVENKGLCLLLAWTNEVIQRGSGWYPGE